MAGERLTWHIVGFLKPYRWVMAGAVVVTMLLTVLAMLPPLLMRAVIDRVVGAGDRASFWPLALCMVAVPVLAAVCSLLQSLGLAYAGWRFLMDVRVGLYQHLLGLSMRFFGKHSTGMLVNRLMGDSSTVGNMLSQQSLTVISDVICSGFAVAATFAINWRMALILVAVVVLFAGNWKLNIGQLRRVGRSYWQSFDRLSGGIQNRLSANLAVKTFGAEQREQRVFEGQSATALELLSNANTTSNTFWMNTSLIQNLGRSVIFFLGCALVLRGDMTYGDVVAFTAYAMQLLWPAIRFSEMARQIQDFRVAIERISEILAEQPEIAAKPGALPVGRLKGGVRFENVHFHYEPGRPVIRGFDLEVAPGETVALIGPTGCGKSTILTLLMRFYDTSSGEIRLDGLPVQDLELDSLRRQFGIVLQDPLLFNVSIADNLRYARPGATRADLEAAARVAEIHDFIMSLPDGYDTVIGSEGIQLSTGQKQRITIARAVAADPAILIMDEATSALDSESEHAIQLAMQRVLKGRTAFIVAHRLSTIRNADRIIVLKGGVISEMGRHEELMALPDGHYRMLYDRFMSKGVIEEDPA
ncbi:MAG: ABC transporter ATP-binding protein [Lentisphaeria bacterium]